MANCSMNLYKMIKESALVDTPDTADVIDRQTLNNDHTHNIALYNKDGKYYTSIDMVVIHQDGESVYINGKDTKEFNDLASARDSFRSDLKMYRDKLGYVEEDADETYSFIDAVQEQ